MKEKFRQFMIGRYGTDGLNQFLSMASIVLLLLSLLTRFSLFTWLGLALLILCQPQYFQAHRGKLPVLHPERPHRPQVPFPEGSVGQP